MSHENAKNLIFQQNRIRPSGSSLPFRFKSPNSRQLRKQSPMRKLVMRSTKDIVPTGFFMGHRFDTLMIGKSKSRFRRLSSSSSLWSYGNLFLKRVLGGFLTSWKRGSRVHQCATILTSPISRDSSFSLGCSVLLFHLTVNSYVYSQYVTCSTPSALRVTWNRTDATQANLGSSKVTPHLTKYLIYVTWARDVSRDSHLLWSLSDESSFLKSWLRW